MAGGTAGRRDERPARAARIVATLVSMGAALGALAQTAAPCTPELGRIVSVQGMVELRRGDSPWSAVQRDAPLCGGDTLRVRRYGRAALRLSNETLLRLDQETTLTLAPPDPVKQTLFEQLSGGLHVMTRTPRKFNLRTPFVNANIEGTEFALRVTDRDTTVAVFEGTVQAVNDAGSQAVGSGEQATAAAGSAPRKGMAMTPADAVAWTLYLPAVFDPGAAGARLGAAAQESVERYRAGRVGDALAALGGAAPDAAAALLVYRAALLLQIGRIDEARPALAQALKSASPATASDAHALLAVIALAGNDKDAALDLARQARGEKPDSPGTLIALSYAQQARFQIEPALASAREAVRLDPGNPLAQARRAELELSLGDLDAASAAAQEAVRLDPGVAKTQSVLGFASLARIDTRAARAAFRRAIELDQADPLPRLGLGLADIRDGDLAAGRAEIETAAILDPGNSLVRSYLGKAYYDEKRDDKAAPQFALATERDPRDPTPHYYGAVMAQADGHPVEALQALQQSIALNDNRAVYRSRLLLDQDQAARSARLAYTYRELGFDALATVEAVKSLSLDPTDSAAHRFLADSYLGQIKTEAARASELLQSQLRQPLGLNTLQPQLLRDPQFRVETSGLTQAGAYEFNPLFTRNQVAVKLDAMAGSASTAGDQIFISGLKDSVAWSLGQYRFQTEGLRANNDQREDLLNAFVQVALSPTARIQAELRSDIGKQGDLAQRFDPSDFSTTLREDTRLNTLRLGGWFALDPRSDLVASAIVGTGRDHLYTTDASYDTDDRERLQSLELQYAHHGQGWHVLGGASLYRNQATVDDGTGAATVDTREQSLYAQLTFTGLGLVPVLGLSWDTFDRPGLYVARVNPKLGLVWPISADTTLRAAAFSVVKRSFVANQTLQPAQIAGFNQFFDDPDGTRSRRAGVALDQRLTPALFAGAEASARDLDVPGFAGDADYRWRERLARLYANAILGPHATATLEVQGERFERPEANTGNEFFTHLRTVFVPLGLRLHALGPWSASLKATWVNQQIQYFDPNNDLIDARGRFVVTDFSAYYRLPQRLGIVSLEARNLFDRRFSYQEIDVHAGSRVSPGRVVVVRFSLAF